MVVRPDAPKQDGWTALFHATKFGSSEMVALLLSAGAEPESIDPAGRNTIYWGACNIDDSRAASIVSLLLERGVSPDWTAADGRTPIFGAVLNGNPLAVKALLDGGASVHVQMVDPRSGLHLYPLDVAAGQGESEIVSLLADAGAPYDEELTRIELDENDEESGYSYCFEFSGASEDAQGRLHYLFDDCSWDAGLAVIRSEVEIVNAAYKIRFVSKRPFRFDVETQSSGGDEDSLAMAIVGKGQLLSNLFLEIQDLGEDAEAVELVLVDDDGKRWRCELSKYGGLRPLHGD